MISALVGCTDGEKDYGYFKNISSTGAFTAVETGVTLPDGVSVYSFDAENEVFVTCRDVFNTVSATKVTLFGLCGFSEIYVDPMYSSIEEIRGDYAIVIKPMVDDGEQINAVGVIRFRGGEKAELTEFTPAESGVKQFQFVGDYIVTLGLKSYPSDSFKFSTFYDYSQGRLLEAFRLRCDSSYTFEAFDDYVVAIGKDHAFFYEKSNNVNGFLVPYRSSGNEEDAESKYGYYYPYPEDATGQYADYVKIDIFYLGNGWFSRTAQMRQEEIYDGYQIVYDELDTSTFSVKNKTYYANVRCDFYNARTHETRASDWLIVRAVANRYHADYYAQSAAYLNNLASYSEDLSAYEYHLPYLDPAQAIKDGYSIVYYFYLPYVSEDNYYAETSFCIMDEKLVVDRLSQAEILMPPVFIDGYGVPTADPIYEPYFGSVYLYDNALDRTELLPYVGGKKTYQSFFFYKNGVVAQEIDYDNVTTLYGIVSSDGRVLIDFIYDSLTPFFGEYAVGVRGKSFVRIASDGSTTALTDVLNVRQGVYVFVDREKLGLKSYDGTELIAAECDGLEVLETVMRDGVFLRSYAVATKGVSATIYRLK